MCQQGKVCSLPFCKLRGLPKRRPKSRRGRTPREQRWMADHPICEEPGCGRPSTECHHVGGRRGKRRDTAPLRAYCLEHHRGEHGERIATPLGAPSSLRWIDLPGVRA